MPSADGRGRTLWEILSGRNQKDMRPLEFQYHNPLEAKIGCTVCFDHEPEISGINFVIDKITVYKQEVHRQEFFLTDYCLRGVSLDHDKPVRMRLRLIPDEDTTDDLGHKIQLLYLYDEMPADENFRENVLGDETGEFWVNHADDGSELEEPRTYWRRGGTDHCPNPDPYESRCTDLSDVDGDGTVEDDELEHYNMTSWEYSRMTDDEAGQEYEEFLTIEQDCDSGYFTFLRGRDVLPSQITVF